MKKKIILLFLAFIFLLSQVMYVQPVEAKGFKSSRSFSKSFGGSKSSFKSTWGGSSTKGYSGSSKSGKSSLAKSLFGSSKSGSSSTKAPASSKSGSASGSKSGSTSTASSSSSSRKVPGSFSSGSKSVGGYSGSSSSQKSTKSSVKQSSSTKKTSYMQDTYKKTASQRSYKAYKQNLDAEQQKVYETSFNNSYTVNNRMNFEEAMGTRNTRISSFGTRRININIRPTVFGGPISYGSAFVGPWDLWFLMRASDLFWYHHWLEILPYRNYFEEREFADMERRVSDLEQKYNGQRDSSYLEPEVDYDLQLSQPYQEKNLDRIYATDRYSGTGSNTVVTILILAIIAVGLILLIKGLNKPKRRSTYHSRLY